MKQTANYSLRTWVFTVTLAPTILVSLMLGGFYTLSLFSELETTLEEQGKNIMTPLVIAAEQGLKENNREALKILVDRMHRSHSPLINTIAVYNEHNQLFVTSHYHRMIGEFSDFNTRKLPDKLTIENSGEHIIITSPISIEITQTTADLDQERVIGHLMMQLNSDDTLLAQHRVAITTFIIILLGVQLNLFFTFRLINNVTRPIGDMVRAVAKIREGKLDTRLQGNLIGELEILKRGINAIAGSLKEYHEKMQHNIDTATSELRETMEQIEIKNVELDIANRKAQEGSRIKSEFLANMSHELRTPLNGVIGLTQQLLKTQLMPNQIDYLQTIEKSAQGLFNIIKDILDFSKLEAGKLHLDAMPFSLRDTIADVTDILATSAHEKNLDLLVNISPSTIDNVIGDNQRFQQILTNLIGNAIKFTKKGHVSLNIYSKQISNNQHKLFFDVIDTGIGIQREHLPRLFNAFAQADSSISRKYGGSGLGLIITKRLIEEMGGAITCASEPGIGSQFSSNIVVEESNANPAFHINARLHKNIQVFCESIQHASILNQQINHWQANIDNFTDLHEWSHASGVEEYDCAIIHYPGPYDNLIALEDLIKAAQGVDNVIVLIDTNDLTVHQNIIALGVNYCHINPISCRRLFNSIEKIQAYSTRVVPKPEPEAVKYPKKRALLVDDNEANLKLISTMLKDKVGSLVLATNGEEAVEACCVQKFDIIFMDIQMPVLDGVQATAIIRKHGINQLAPIVATTAHALEEEKQVWLNKGMDDFLTKPLREDAVDNILEHWLDSSHMKESLAIALQADTDDTLSESENPHVSWQASLAQAMGKKDLAIEMLQMLIDSIPATISSIESAVSNQDSKELLRVIHKLHGACCYTGVPQLKDLAHSIETALKQQATLSDMEPEILEILDELQLVATVGNTILNKESDTLNEQ
ncbi:two-component sensor histidine kinase BarA [Psychrobium sp. MM17-31]|uniref:two-component sensor histidine kinase BarA n=1 Tax=Psychrobium sp. MM17-31 TaxID=2917758 RepID=UPI001EF52984|nr:two-component sensor histidine kinase BarA [Psychrobium sp. MM17-31]MCG7529874.1 two-component sensor histidine kinase BarA [Psychrobium sp. MM17-31]